MENNESGKFDKNFDLKNNQIFCSPSSILVIYTVLSILVKMKEQLGLEAMLEYINKYLSIIEKNNPHIQRAVSCTIQYMNVGKIFSDAMYKKEE